MRLASVQDHWMIDNASLNSEPGSTAVKSADRVLDLLEQLAARPAGVSHSELATALGIPKSSLSQLLRTLGRRGYVEFEPTRRAYLLGERFEHLAQLARRRPDIVSLAQPLLDELTKTTGESSALNIVEDDQLKVVATSASRHRLVSHMHLGDLAPLYATSGGKVVLAWLGPAEFDGYLKRVPLIAVTADTIVEAGALHTELKTVRRQGFAKVSGEFTPGIVGLAVPVWSGEVVTAALNVATPTVRYSDELHDRIVASLIGAATRLSAALSAD